MKQMVVNARFSHQIETTLPDVYAIKLFLSFALKQAAAVAAERLMFIGARLPNHAARPGDPFGNSTPSRSKIAPSKKLQNFNKSGRKASRRDAC